MADKPPKALVKNAASSEQVKKAGEKEESRADQELQDLRLLLSIAEGRRFIWRLMVHCNVFSSVFGDSDRDTNRKVGKQDVGHFLLMEVDKARPEALLEMMTDSKRTNPNG
jgi:hypothetical protein